MRTAAVFVFMFASTAFPLHQGSALSCGPHQSTAFLLCFCCRPFHRQHLTRVVLIRCDADGCCRGAPCAMHDVRVSLLPWTRQVFITLPLLSFHCPCTALALSSTAAVVWRLNICSWRQLEQRVHCPPPPIPLPAGPVGLREGADGRAGHRGGERADTGPGARALSCVLSPAPSHRPFPTA